MKKLTALFVALIICLSFSACERPTAPGERRYLPKTIGEEIVYQNGDTLTFRGFTIADKIQKGDRLFENTGGSFFIAEFDVAFESFFITSCGVLFRGLPVSGEGENTEYLENGLNNRLVGRFVSSEIVPDGDFDKDLNDAVNESNLNIYYSGENPNKTGAVSGKIYLVFKLNQTLLNKITQKIATQTLKSSKPSDETKKLSIVCYCYNLIMSDNLTQIYRDLEIGCDYSQINRTGIFEIKREVKFS